MNNIIASAGACVLFAAAWLLGALLFFWFWKIGMVPLGVQALTYWQVWALLGLAAMFGFTVRVVYVFNPFR